MNYTFLTLLIILTSICEGQYYRVKALLYKNLPENAQGDPIYIPMPLEKFWLTLLRTVMFGQFWYHTSFLEALGMAFLFPLIHDGFYNMVRHYYNHDRPGFFGHSDEDSSLLSIHTSIRIIMFCVGVLMICIYYIVH